MNSGWWREEESWVFFFFPFLCLLTVQHRSFTEAGHETAVEEEEKRVLKWPTQRGRGSHVVIDESGVMLGKREWRMVVEVECVLMYVIALVFGEKEFERQGEQVETE